MPALFASTTPLASQLPPFWASCHAKVEGSPIIRFSESALTLGMLLNTMLGRPARSLVAYDGR